MTDTNHDQAPQESHADWARRITEQRRQAAYADPHTGSDRHFAEAARLDAQGQTAEAEEARAAGLARAEAIAGEYPWPAV